MSSRLAALPEPEDASMLFSRCNFMHMSSSAMLRRLHVAFVFQFTTDMRLLLRALWGLKKTWTHWPRRHGFTEGSCSPSRVAVIMPMMLSRPGA